MWKHEIISMSKDYKCNDFINFHIGDMSNLNSVTKYATKLPFEYTLVTFSYNYMYRANEGMLTKNNRVALFATQLSGKSIIIDACVYCGKKKEYGDAYPFEWITFPYRILISDNVIYCEEWYNTFDRMVPCTVKKERERFYIDINKIDNINNFKELNIVKISNNCIFKANAMIYYCALMTTLNLMACKNISTKEILPPEKVNKKRLKNGKLPLYSYHILEVTGVQGGKSIRNGSSGITQRLHFQRGHFKQYTEDNKLFGKHTGLYWWQPHLRGTNKDGFVDKDYNIKTE